MRDIFGRDDFGFGIKFIESPDRANVQLGDRPCVTKYGDSVEWISPAYRAEINGWLRSEFGTTNAVEEHKFYVSTMYGLAFATPRSMDLLRMVV